MQNDRKKAVLLHDLLLAAGILLAAGLLSLLLRPGGSGAWVVVSADGREVARYPLDQDLEVVLGGEAYNVLQIRGGGAAVTDANCGDRTCVAMGPIFREGETIVCLPHRLIIRVEGVA